MDTYNTLCEAIRNKRQIVAVYQNKIRELCPHSIGEKVGKNGKPSKINCLCYQFGGESSKGVVTPNSNDNWRCLPIEGLTILEVRDGHWYSGGNHSQPNSCIDNVHLEVADSTQVETAL